MPPMPENSRMLQERFGRLKSELALVEVLVFGVMEEMQHALDRHAKPTRQCFQVWLETLDHAHNSIEKCIRG